MNREMTLRTPAFRCANASWDDPRPHNAVRRGLAAAVVQLAGGILHQRKRQSGLAGILRKMIPEDSLCQGVLVSAVAVSIDAAGMALARTNLDDNPLLVVLSGRRMLDREDRESAHRVAGEDLQQRLVPDVALGLPVELVAQLTHINLAPGSCLPLVSLCLPVSAVKCQML